MTLHLELSMDSMELLHLRINEHKHKHSNRALHSANLSLLLMVHQHTEAVRKAW